MLLLCYFFYLSSRYRGEGFLFLGLFQSFWGGAGVVVCDFLIFSSCFWGGDCVLCVVFNLFQSFPELMSACITLRQLQSQSVILRFLVS